MSATANATAAATVVRGAPHALVLRWRQATCVVLAGDVLAIDHDGEDARVSVDGPPLPLAERVPGADDSDEHAPIRLIVRARRRYVAFRVAAALELIERITLYKLPRVLRSAGCATWVRGVALLRDDVTGAETPVPWIDLGELAGSEA